MAICLSERIGAQIIRHLVFESRWGIESKELACAQVTPKSRGDKIGSRVAGCTRKNLRLRICYQDLLNTFDNGDSFAGSWPSYNMRYRLYRD